jgi:hypothetical protein
MTRYTVSVWMSAVTISLVVAACGSKARRNGTGQLSLFLPDGGRLRPTGPHPATCTSRDPSCGRGPADWGRQQAMRPISHTPLAIVCAAAALLAGCSTQTKGDRPIIPRAALFPWRLRRGSGGRALMVRALAALGSLALLAGCGLAVIDPNRRHLASAGLGGASFVDDRSRELKGGWSLHGAYDYRLTGPDTRWVGVTARAVGHTVLGARVRGEELEGSCDLFWTSVGPALGLRIPAHSEMAFVADGGGALTYVSRDRCAASGRRAATAVTPHWGMGLQSGVTPRSAWRLGFRQVRLPLRELGLASGPEWAAMGEVSLVFAF